MPRDDSTNWKTLPFSEAVEINPRRPLRKNDNVPFLDMASLPLNGASVVVSEHRPVSSGGARFQAGDTLFARITPCAENGKLGFVRAVAGGGVAQGSTEFIVMAGREGVTLPEYVSFLAGWDHVRDQAIALMEGTSGRQRVPGWAFGEIDVPVPPLVEQRRIAEVLQAVETLSEATLAATKAAMRLKAAAAEHFMSQAISEEEVQLHQVIQFMDSGWSPDCEPRGAADGEWAILKTSSVTWEGYDDGENKALPASLAPRPHLAVEPSDILITRAGQAYRTGVVAIVDSTIGKRMISDKLVRVRANPERVIPLVLAEILKSKTVQKQLSPLKSGLTTLTNVTQKMIGDLIFNLPNLDEQVRFANFLSSLNETIENSRTRVLQLDILRAGLKGDLLSGRVRVPA